MGNSSARFVAEFYLARIYAADAGPAKDPAKAFVLYRKLADENLTIDPRQPACAIRRQGADRARRLCEEPA